MRPILIFVDELESFYQMPINVWESFQKTKEYKKLIDIGYSEHIDNIKFLANKTNHIDLLIEDLTKVN